MRWNYGLLVLCIAGSLAAPPVLRAGSFVNFESGHVRPLALSPSKSLLFAANTPDNRVEVFRATARRPRAAGAGRRGPRARCDRGAHRGRGLRRQPPLGFGVRPRRFRPRAPVREGDSARRRRASGRRDRGPGSRQDLRLDRAPRTEPHRRPPADDPRRRARRCLRLPCRRPGRRPFRADALLRYAPSAGSDSPTGRKSSRPRSIRATRPPS
jgi:hypothetical protein